MTLSIAWRHNGGIHLASDSRIKLGENQYADIGIKVLSIPVRVRGTVRNKSGKLRCIFESRYGFCYAGSLVNASTLKELLEELLREVQYVGLSEKPSFDDICNTIKRYCSYISTEFCNYLADKGKYEFFLVGYCPLDKGSKAAHFSLEHQAGEAIAKFNLILENDDSYFAIGTGATKFKSINPIVNDREMLLALNTVIDCKDVESVGGDIQHGCFEMSGDFVINGIARTSTETAVLNDIQHGPTVIKRYKYRGFQLHFEDRDFVDYPFTASLGYIALDVPSNKESHDEFVKRLST